MKKVTLILSALALVLGLSQCKKQETPAQSGEKQHVVLTANNGNDGSKVAASFASAALNLTWEGNETIAVSGGASGTLTYKSGVGTPNATFEGDITIDRGGDIVFTIGSAPEDEDFADQAGTADGCAAWIKEHNHFVGKSQWQDDGNYNVTMELQYAVLKLDVSALGTSGEMTIAAGATVASVTNVSGIASAVFVAVPADGSTTAYTITCGGKTATKTWTLEKNVFYTKAGAEGAGTGEAIVIKHEFSVGSGKTVEFAPGNLYWNGSAFKFEANQWDTKPAYSETEEGTGTWDPNHVSHFFWSNTTDWQTPDKEPYAASYSCSTQTTDDVFFTNSSSFQVAGETAGTWRTLTRDEWKYLLNTSGSSGRTDASRFAKAKVKDVCGLLIFPDNYSGTASGTGIADVNDTEAEFPTSNILDDTWKAMESAGAVFLPAAGYRLGMDVLDVGSYGNYWSGTPSGDNACSMYFDSDNVDVGSDGWDTGLAVRLVRNITE